MDNEKKASKIITQEDIFKILNTCYNKALTGIDKVSPPIEEFAGEYLKKNPDKEQAVKAMLRNQIAKCTTSGFITGFGGIITLPVSIPANVGSVLYVQMRMIACTAYLAGYDLKDDQVQTFVYACLAGISVNQVLKQTGIKLATKVATKGIQKIPGKVLTKINQKIGFKFITKFGQKGIINLGKMVPVVGSVINGGFDFAETKVIANRAYKMFFENDFSVGDAETSENNMEVSSIE